MTLAEYHDSDTNHAVRARRRMAFHCCSCAWRSCDAAAAERRVAGDRIGTRDGRLTRAFVGHR